MNLNIISGDWIWIKKNIIIVALEKRKKGNMVKDHWFTHCYVIVLEWCEKLQTNSLRMKGIENIMLTSTRAVHRRCLLLLLHWLRWVPITFFVSISGIFPRVFSKSYSNWLHALLQTLGLSIRYDYRIFNRLLIYQGSDYNHHIL